MKVQSNSAGYNAATGLELVVGEMEVSEEQAASLEAAGLLSKGKRAAKPEKKEED